MTVFTVSDNLILLNIKVSAGASRSQFGDIRGDRLGVKIAAQPEDGKANAELRAFLAQALDCPKKDIVLKTGEKSRFKTLALPLAVREKLEKIVDSF
jgi:uncharacterized protein (TIGR00251 family)